MSTAFRISHLMHRYHLRGLYGWWGSSRRTLSPTGRLRSPLLTASSQSGDTTENNGDSGDSATSHSSPPSSTSSTAAGQHVPLDLDATSLVSYSEAMQILNYCHPTHRLPADIQKIMTSFGAARKASVQRLHGALVQNNLRAFLIKRCWSLPPIRNKLVFDSKLHWRIAVEVVPALVLPVVREIYKRSHMHSGDASGESVYVLCESLANALLGATFCCMLAPEAHAMPLYAVHSLSWLRRPFIASVASPFIPVQTTDYALQLLARVNALTRAATSFLLVCGCVGWSSQAAANFMYSHITAFGSSSSSSSNNNSNNNNSTAKHDKHEGTLREDECKGRNETVAEEADEESEMLSATPDTAAVQWGLYALLSALPRYQALSALDILVESSSRKSRGWVATTLALRALNHMASFAPFESVSFLLDSIADDVSE